MLESLFSLHIPFWEMLARFGVAMLVGAVVGWERESARRSAGLRTHMLVALGAAGFSLIGAELSFTANEALAIAGTPGRGSDPLRVVDAVATGIGFLGAGAILHSAERVKGLTTAASIWVTAAAGVASGVGLWSIALMITVCALFTLGILKTITKRPLDTSSGD